MNVIVKAGTAVIGGSVVSLASDTQVPISAADANYPRFDLITLKSDGTIGYYAGTPEAPVAVDTTKPETYVKPRPPATPAGEVALAEVFVPVGATAIDKIIDRRIVTNLATPQITSGRLPMSRMPDGEAGKVLVAQGIGADPAYADPNFNLIQVGGTNLTARDWSADFAKLQNLDVALSSRASESTLAAIKNALASVGTDKIRASVVDALPESPFNLTKVAGTALTARDWSGDLAKLQNLDVTLTTLAKLIRRGRNVEPVWIYGDEVTAPAANTPLVSQTVSTGKTGYIYGIFIASQEANDFKLNWVSGGVSKSIRIVFSGKGSLMSTFEIPINEGLGADAGSSITITNVNAGSTGIVYQAGILYAEV
jgi:hypothetical protein